jgi:phosphate transport system permease protein
MLALLVAVPTGIGLALFLTQFAPDWFRSIASFPIELLAGIPSVVYGLWGLAVLVPLLRNTVEPALAASLGFLPFFQGAPIGLGYLAAGLLLSLMILPTITSLSVEVLRTVPQGLREGALALGATRTEMVRMTVLPYARTGILGAVLLGLGRALGETMAVTMVIGNSSGLSLSLFSPGYTLPSVIANEFAEASGSAHTSALAGLGLLLFLVTVALNVFARLLLRRISRQGPGGPAAKSGKSKSVSTNSWISVSLVRRHLLDKLLVGLCGFALVCAVVPLASLLWLVLSRGFAGLSWAFLTHLPAPVGETGGGVANALVGSFQIVGLAGLIGVPLGVGAGLFLAEQGSSRWGDVVRFIAEVLSGVPSIVVGIVAYGLLVLPMHRFSALAGSLALAVLMVPGLARSTEELVRLVPGSLREGSLALGVPEWRTSLFVVLRTATAGIMTAILMALARAVGETAPLLFTSLGNQFWNLRPDQPTATLTVQIFNFAVSPYEDWQRQAWSAALVLLLVVGALSTLARLLARSHSQRAK